MVFWETCVDNILVSFLCRTLQLSVKVRRVGFSANSTNSSRSPSLSGVVMITWRVPRFPPASQSTTFAKRTKRTPKRKWMANVKINKLVKLLLRIYSSTIKAAGTRINISRFGTSVFRTRRTSSTLYETAENDEREKERQKRKDTQKCWDNRNSKNTTSRAPSHKKLEYTNVKKRSYKVVFVKTGGIGILWIVVYQWTIRNILSS